MTIEIKQSTAITFLLGPFVDITDGVTPEEGLATNMDNATTGIRVSKNGAAGADRNSATAPAHDNDGFYRVELSNTDTNTLGFLQVQYEELGVALPAWKDFSVLTANAWDSKYSTDNLQVDVIQIVGQTVPAPGVTGVPDVNVTHFVDELAPAPIITGVPDVNAVRILDVAPSLTNSDLDVNIAQVIGTAPTLTSTNIDVNVIGGVAPLGTAMRGTDGVDTATMRGTDSALLAASINLTGGVLDTVTTAINLTTNNDKAGYALSAAGVNAVADAILPETNAALTDIPFLFVAASDGRTPVTGASTITITRSLDGAAFGAVSGTTVTEIGNGMYHIDASAADLNAGKIVFRIAATGGTPGAPDDAFVTVVTRSGV